MNRGFRMKQKYLYLFATGVMALSLGTVANADDPQIQATEAAAAKAAAFANDIYIVQLSGDPVIAYEGEIKGYKATKPGKGQKINRNSAHVKKYAAHLEDQQDQVIDSAGATKVYSYRYVFNAFAARMSAADAQALRGRSDVVNVWRDEIRYPDTDATPNYLNISGAGEAWSKGYAGEDVVIGIIDTGVWPENPSFADVPTPHKGNKGGLMPYSPPSGFTPSGCDFGNTAANPADAPFACNNKVVAARCYNLGQSSAIDPSNPCGGNGIAQAGLPFVYQSARDDNGHGSHTGSTAGGNYGVDAGGGALISGIAPRAHIAAYKVCWAGGGCASSDSAAAIDQAVADGVDVINFSIGGSSNFFAAPDDIAFLFAADAGVWVATSNGNAGPGPGTVGTPSGVPWITAVGATQDEGVFYNQLVVHAPGSVAGGYTAVEGASPVTLADTGAITADITMVSGDGLACGPVDPISGIALASRGACSFSTKYNNAAAAGASAIIVFNDGANSGRIDPIVMSAPGTTIPGVMIGHFDGVALAGESGVNGTLDPNAAISAANRIAGFSSRGPNNGAPDIIKPDVSAPGVAILAAGAGTDTFISINGTSMASPHVAGTFALLKEAHPDWSAAMARSAVMTTARNGLLKTFGTEPADPFDVGAGEVSPSDVFDPGMAYDAGFLDYLAVLCTTTPQVFADPAGTCAFLESIGFSLDPSELNLPSIGVGDLVGTQTVTRTLTGASHKNGWKTYTVSVDAPPGIDVSVSPSTITVKNGVSADYEVTFNVTGTATLDEWAFGSLAWERPSEYSVRSPIDYDVAFGYDGDFNAAMDGLDEGDATPGAVPDGGADLHFGQMVPPGTTLARFALYDDEIGASNDLDMQVFGPASAGYPFVCSSGTGTSEEQCDLANPAPGEYAVFVIDFASAAGPTPYTLWLFNLDGADAGSEQSDRGFD
jgi:subtilisin family serine protease